MRLATLVAGSKAQAENHRREVEGMKNRFRRKEREDVRGGLGELREIFLEEESDGIGEITTLLEP